MGWKEKGKQSGPHTHTHTQEWSSSTFFLWAKGSCVVEEEEEDEEKRIWKNPSGLFFYFQKTAMFLRRNSWTVMNFFSCNTIIVWVCRRHGRFLEDDAFLLLFKKWFALENVRLNNPK